MGTPSTRSVIITLFPMAQETPSELRSQHAELLALVSEIQKYLLVRGLAQ